MDENGQTPTETLLCGACSAAYDAEDNFCRECGVALEGVYYPAVQEEPKLPAPWKPPVPAAVVKGAAFVAAGTVAEILVRRMARGAMGRMPWSKKQAGKGPVAARQDGSVDGDAHMVSETFLMRRVRFRR